MHTTKDGHYRWEDDRCSGLYLYARKSLNGSEGPQQTVIEGALWWAAVAVFAFNVYLFTLIVYNTENMQELCCPSTKSMTIL